jgi:hypothetical protein
MALSKDQATAAATKVPGKNSRSKAVPQPTAIDVVATQVSDDLAAQYVDFLTPVPAPSVATKTTPTVASKPTSDSSIDARSVGLGAAVGVVVAGEALIEGAGMLARGLVRLLR